jgi:PmbA protein
MSIEKNPKQLAKQVMDVAMQAGASGADAYVRTSSEISLSVRNGEIESVKQAATTGLALRATVDGRTALVHSTDMGRLSLINLAKQAIKMAKLLPESKEPTIYTDPMETGSPFHPDPGLGEEPLEAKAARLREIEKAMMGVSGVTGSGGVGYTEHDGEIAYANSKDVSQWTPFSRVEIGVEAYAEQDGDNYTGGYYQEVSSRKQLKSAEEIGVGAGERAASQLGARKLETTKAPVIFTPFNGWTVLLCLAAPLRGDNITQGRSYLADKLGETIAASLVTIIDDATMSGGPATRAFDGEGVPAKRLEMVKNGVLQSYFTDLGSARKLGLEPGGNAMRRSYTSQPEIGASNYSLTAGSQTPEEIIKSTRRGLLLNNLSGWWVGISPIADDYSSAAIGYWIEDGEIAYPVKGINIGGSLREMLANVDMIGNDLSFRAPTSTPTFRVAEMSISGT